MPSNSRKVRGRRTEIVVADYLRSYYPNAMPVNSGASGSDISGVPWDVEVKARSKFAPLEFIKQLKNRNDGRLGFAIMRCNGQGENAEDYVFIARLGDMMPLLEDKVPSEDIARCKGCGSWTIINRICEVCKSISNQG